MKTLEEIRNVAHGLALVHNDEAYSMPIRVSCGVAAGALYWALEAEELKDFDFTSLDLIAKMGLKEARKEVARRN